MLIQQMGQIHFATCMVYWYKSCELIALAIDKVVVEYKVCVNDCHLLQCYHS
jgi:hypothetical protein